MEIINLRLQNLHGTSAEETTYSVSIKVPAKDELLSLLPNHLQCIKHPMQFKTGILSTVIHTLELCLFREYHEPKLGVYVKIGDSLVSTCNRYIIEVRTIDINYVCESKATVEDILTNCAPPRSMEVEGVDFWEAKCGWPESTSLIFLTVTIVKRLPLEFENENVDNLSPVQRHGGKLNTKPFFMSEEFSDLTIQCDGKKFPVHRIVLATRSKYFAALLSTSMKETKEGVIKINDMDCSVLQELLRFLYMDQVENLETHVKDLFVAADKYGLNDLRGICERHLLQTLNVDNAMEIYDLCQMHCSHFLIHKAKEIIVWNKSRFIPDTESFVAFTNKYPELMFDLFQM